MCGLGLDVKRGVSRGVQSHRTLLLSSSSGWFAKISASKLRPFKENEFRYFPRNSLYPWFPPTSLTHDATEQTLTEAPRTSTAESRSACSVLEKEAVIARRTLERDGK